MLIGFCGSRSLSFKYAPLAQGIAQACACAGCNISVGCASGADAFIRSSVPVAKVWKAKDFGFGKSSFALRSIAFVKSLDKGSLVAFVASPCPDGLLPSSSPQKCFCGLGSGTWASLALAVGLKIKVYVFWCSTEKPVLPSKWGKWEIVKSGVFTGSWLLK